MDKIWYIFIYERQEGPYSFDDLKKDKRISPDTYAWCDGMADWKKIGDIPELDELFHDDEAVCPPLDLNDGGSVSPGASEEIALALGGGLPPYIFLLIVIALVCLYFIISLL